MKKIIIIPILIIISIVVWITIGDAQSKESKNVIDEMITQSSAYKFYGDPDTLPQNMIDTLSEYKVVLMGEIHYVKEHQIMMGAMLQRLHDSGFRYYVQEVGSANSVLVDHYIKGDMKSLPEVYLNLDKDLINSLHAFNLELREQGRASEQISYLGFDMNHYHGIYVNSIQELQKLYRSEALEIYSKSLLNESEDARAQQNLMREFALLLNDLKPAENGLDAMQIQTLQWMTENEINSMDLRFNFDDQIREDYIEKEVIRSIEKSAEDEKLLINCGSWHAQLIPHWVKGSNRNFRWLGMRLVDYFNERPDGFYSIAVTAYSGELKSNISSSNRKEFSTIQSRSNYKLIPALYKAYGDRNVFLDYVPFSDSDIKITVDYPYNTVMLKPNEQFNGLFVYPKVTVPDELKYFEN